jgi:hypothetical protein
MRGPVIVVGLSHEGPELVVTACSAFVLKRFVQVEDAHDAGATDHKRFLCSQVHHNAIVGVGSLSTRSALIVALP